MSITAPPVQHRPAEVLLPLARSWLVGFAALVGRCGGRHRRLLRPLVLRIERRLAMWLFLSACARLTLPPTRGRPALPLSASFGFRCVRTSRARLRHLARCFGQGSLAARLARGRVASRLIAVAPPTHTWLGALGAITCAPADTS